MLTAIQLSSAGLLQPRDSVLCLEGMALEHRDVLREESAVSKLLRDHQRQ